MSQQSIVVVTIHGIGFQHPPGDGSDGYADPLHAHLHDELKELLGDDPNRKEKGVSGAVYVQSNYSADVPPANYIVPSEPGLARLGTWKPNEPHDIDHSASWQGLVDAGQPVAHVALVYSNLEGVGSHAAALLETSSKAAFSLTHYTSVVGAVRLVLQDVAATIKGDRAAAGQAGSPSLRVRRDMSALAHRSIFQRSRPAQPPANGSGAMQVWETVQDDIATYVCRNDIREDVRLFVREALLRLASRDDVAGIVINAHSQGTVVAYDVVRELPEFAATKVKAFVTAGSPLRKYVDCFTWGDEVGCIWQIAGPPNGWFAPAQGDWVTGTGWINFWDRTDPVADPLSPSKEWRPGDAFQGPPDGYGGLFRAHDPDSGKPLNLAIADREVDNWQHSTGGGLQSHNYWDNTTEFVKPLAGIVRTLIKE